MKIVIVATGFVALIAACSSTSNRSTSKSKAAETTPPVTTTSAAPPSHATSATSVPNLASQLLTVTDLPTGWAVDNSSQADTAAPTCLKQAKAITDTTSKARADFIKGTDIPTLADSVGYYGTTSAAQQKFSAASQVLTSCKNVSFDSDGTHVAGTVGALSFPQLGDRSAAWQFAFNANGQSFGAIEVLIQKDAELELLGLVDLTPSVSELEELCRRAVAKLP